MKSNRKYRGWQMNSKDPDEEVKDAIKYFISIYGKPPEIIEHSISLKLKPPESHKDIEFIGIKIPENILLLGE